MARSRKDIFGGTTPQANISPMIDLVFLLLIFFMVASTMITHLKDKNVNIPVAPQARVPELIEGRVVINVYEDGSIHDESGQRELSTEDVERMMAEAYAKNPDTRLLVRADRNARHGAVKEVIEASARGGVSDIIFATWVTDN